MALRLESEPAGSIIDDLDGVREVWHDVLPLLDAAADELTLGDLLHGQNFHLQEAMSALEMGDPQMDSMASAEPEEDPAPSLPPDTISAADLVGVLDDMLCCEHAWYGSSPLAHSLFRLDWLHAIPDIRPLELRAPLLAAVKSASAVRALVLRGDVAEEEDFVPSVSGLNLQEHTSEVEVAKQLMAAEEATQLRLTALKAGGEAGGEAGAEAGGEVEAPEALEAVLSRLRFRRGLLTALTAMLRPNAKAAELARKMLAFATAQVCDIVDACTCTCTCGALPRIASCTASCIASYITRAPLPRRSWRRCAPQSRWARRATHWSASTGAPPRSSWARRRSASRRCCRAPMPSPPRRRYSAGCGPCAP